MTTTSKEKMWNLFFPGQPMPEPYEGAMEECAGCLGKLLPEDMTDEEVDEAIRKALRGR